MCSALSACLLFCVSLFWSTNQCVLRLYYCTQDKKKKKKSCKVSLRRVAESAVVAWLIGSQQWLSGHPHNHQPRRLTILLVCRGSRLAVVLLDLLDSKPFFAPRMHIPFIFPFGKFTGKEEEA